MDRAFRVAFGQALRKFRRGRGFTQEKLAFESGIHRTTISLWERGETLPSLDNLRTIAVALDTNASDLLRRAEAQVTANRKRRKPQAKLLRGRPRKSS